MPRLLHCGSAEILLYWLVDMAKQRISYTISQAFQVAKESSRYIISSTNLAGVHTTSGMCLKSGFLTKQGPVYLEVWEGDSFPLLGLANPPGY